MITVAQKRSQSEGMAINASSVLANSDTDSDGEPNTIDANIFWGNLKTPEKSRTVNDLPQTILRPRSTFQTQPHDSPSKLLTIHHPTQFEVGTEPPQITSVHTSIQTDDMNSKAPSLANTSATNTPISIREPARNETTQSLEDGQTTVSETCNNAIEHNSSSLNLDVSYPETDLPVAAKEDCVGVIDVTPVQSRKEFPIAPSIASIADPPTQLSYPTSQSITDAPVQIKTPPKVNNNDQSTPSACHPIFLGTPGARDTSARKDRRTKWKHIESQGRHPLLSLSPSSTSILNLVQSPAQELHSKINITSSPVQKAQRVPASALSHRSPTKPLRLGLFPPSVNLNDPNRIPARRIANPHSPLRNFIHSPARRVPVINSDRTAVNPTVPKMSEQTLHVSEPSSSTHSESTPSQPRDPPTAGHSGDTLGPITAELLSVKTPQKIVGTARGNSVARPGPSRLPVPSSRVGRRPPPSLLSIQKRFDRAATTPSRIPSPLKRKVEDYNVPKSAEIPVRHLQSGSKRKRTDDASEDDADERPQKRMILGIHSTPKEEDVGAKPSIQEITEPSQDSDNPFAMNIDTSPLQSPVKEQARLTERSGIPVMSTSSASSNPRRTSRGRKRTPVMLNDKSPESLPPRKVAVPKSLSKPPSRPPSRSTIRGGVDLETWPENPRQLQIVTSVNTQHNQASLAELEHQVIRRFGNRPPSPSNKFRIDVDAKNREEREARAERRHRRDKDNDTIMLNGDDETVVPSSSKLAQETKRVQAPGDDEDYQTPIKDPIPSKLHPGRMTKTVKWNRGLIDAPLVISRPHTSGQIVRKSCFLRDPKTLTLNFLGNIPNADEPLPGVVKEHFVVSKFIYDDDIQESPRRSKKKAAMRI